MKTSFYAALLMACFAFVGCSNTGDDDDDNTTPSPSPTVTSAGWVGLPDLPTNRQEHPVLVLGGEILVFGGFQTTLTVVATVHAFDPVANTWRTDIPNISDGLADVTMHHANFAVANGKVYVVGFLTGNFVSDGRVLEYDPNANNTWTEKTSMPGGTERGGSQVAAIGDKIYVAGGLRALTTVPDFSVYDATLDTWTPLQDLPEALDHGYGAAVGGVFFVFGGRAGGIAGVNDTTYIFDPNVGSWDTGAVMPTGRGGIAGAVHGGNVHIIGGEGNPNVGSGVYPDHEVYDVSADSWTTLGPMPDPRHGLGAATIGDRIYLPGGGDAQGFAITNRFDAYDVQ